MKRLLRLLAAPLLGTATDAVAATDAFVCSYRGIEVFALVGAVDEMAIGTVWSVSVWPSNFDGPFVSHLPILETAFKHCSVAQDVRFPGPDVEFAEGYAVWKRAVAEDGAGAFSISPAKAYLAVLEVAQ